MPIPRLCGLHRRGSNELLGLDVARGLARRQFTSMSDLSHKQTSRRP